MTSCDSIGTPMATKHLDADLSGTPVEQTKYQSMVGALMYLTASRPDIVHATCYCNRYQAKPTEKHLTAVKRIFRYLKYTIHMGLWYLKDTGFELTAFLDSDHAGCLDSRKSTSSGIQFLGGDKLVRWSSKKHDCTSMSSAEAEYHFKKEKVKKGIVEIFFVGTEYQLADLFTKALSEDRFKYLVRRLGMRCLTPEELEAADTIGCTVMHSQFRYLGVRVGGCMSRRSAWVDTVHKLQSRLSKWKLKTLSIGGRLTLLKSVLGASPLYNMPIFKVPKGVLKDMEAIQSKFFYGADSFDKKITWVAWDKVLASRKNGGLGVSSFHALNRALLLKWVWPFISQDGSLWFNVINSVYGSNLVSHSVSYSSIWCSILREVHVLKGKGFYFFSYCKKRVGDRVCTLLWSDVWISDVPLQDSFPRLFALETDKDASVAVKLGAGSIASSFRREDRWICDLSGDGEFKVKVVRNFLDDMFLPSISVATI
nr:RNA-directed DNA polymerase, eukaryota [Tanacetum cinerariifolium]